MPILKLNVKFSTSVPLMVKVVLPSTLSFAPTVPSSTRTTSFVIGGSTLIVVRLKVFIASTMILLLNALLSLVKKNPLTLMVLLLKLLNTLYMTTLKKSQLMKKKKLSQLMKQKQRHH